MRSILILFSKKNIDLLDKHYSIFYSFFFLFFIGNFQFLGNFIFPGKFINYSILIFCLLSLFLNLRHVPNWKNIKFFIFINSLIISILGVSSYGLKLHYDAAAYHIGHQNWILESNIVFGLNNLNYFYSWSGLNEYILSFFYRSNDYVFLHYPELIAFTTFFSFLIKRLLNFKNLYEFVFIQNIVLFSLLDNVGFKGGGNGFLAILMLGKPSILYGVCSFFFIYNFFNMLVEKKYENHNLVILVFLFTYLIQLRIIGIYLLPLLLIYFYNYSAQSSINDTKIYKILISPIILGFLWIIKNVIITGCLLFPINVTCFDQFSWYDQENTDHVNKINESWPYSYTVGENIYSWFINFVQNEKYLQIFTNFFLSLFIIYVFNKLLYKKIRLFNIEGKSNKFLLILFLFLSFLFWMYVGSIYRYGFALWLSIASFLLVPDKNTNLRYLKIKTLNKFLIAMIFISILLIPRMYSYRNFIENPFNLPEITEPIKNNSSEYYYPNDNLCWSNLNCIFNNDQQEITSRNISIWKLFQVDE